METSEGLNWRTASRSGANGGQCVEVGQDGGAVLVRDTKKRDLGQMAVTADEWRVFVTEVKAG